MTIPNLPTDNLYKFMSIAGLLLIFIPPYFFAKLLYEQEISNIEIIKNTAILEYSSESINELQSYADMLAHELKITVDEANKSHNQEIVKAIPKRTKELLDAQQIVNDKIRKRHTEIQTIKFNIKKYKYIENKIHILYLIMSVFIFVGMVLTFFGFYKWYYKIQIFQNQILELQLSTKLSDSAIQ